jgi:hypothetical protein
MLSDHQKGTEAGYILFRGEGEDRSIEKKGENAAEYERIRVLRFGIGSEDMEFEEMLALGRKLFFSFMGNIPMASFLLVEVSEDSYFEEILALSLGLFPVNSVKHPKNSPWGTGSSTYISEELGIKEHD